MADEFKKLNTVIVGSSVDSAFTHKIWEKKKLEDEMAQEDKDDAIQQMAPQGKICPAKKSA